MEVGSWVVESFTEEAHLVEHADERSVLSFRHVFVHRRDLAADERRQNPKVVEDTGNGGPIEPASDRIRVIGPWQWRPVPVVEHGEQCHPAA